MLGLNKMAEGFQAGAHLGVGQQLLLIVMQQRHRVGLRVIDEDLQAGIQRRAPAIRPTCEDALKHLARPLD